MRKALGAAIRRLRLQRGLTQEELSALAGVTQGAISAAELGQRMPGAGIVIRLAEGLGLTPNELFQEAGLLPSELSGEDDLGFWELWGIMKGMSVQDRREVLRFALYRSAGGRRG